MCLELRSHFFFTEVTKEKKDVTGSENVFSTMGSVDLLLYTCRKACSSLSAFAFHIRFYCVIYPID